MTDPIESPEDFVATLKAEAESQIAEDGDAGDAQAIAFLVTAIRSRDAAVRREALREAADWLARCVPDEPTERNEWQQVLVEAADSLCAIADGAPKDSGAVRWPLRALADSEEP